MQSTRKTCAPGRPSSASAGGQRLYGGRLPGAARPDQEHARGPGRRALGDVRAHGVGDASERQLLPADLRREPLREVVRARSDGLHRGLPLPPRLGRRSLDPGREVVEQLVGGTSGRGARGQRLDLDAEHARHRPAEELGQVARPGEQAGAAVEEHGEPEVVGLELAPLDLELDPSHLERPDPEPPRRRVTGRRVGGVREVAALAREHELQILERAAHESLHRSVARYRTYVRAARRRCDARAAHCGKSLTRAGVDPYERDRRGDSTRTIGRPHATINPSERPGSVERIRDARRRACCRSPVEGRTRRPACGCAFRACAARARCASRRSSG